MSNADPEEVSAVIERDGVSVEKSFEPDDFPVPAIAFVIRSERDVPVEVTLVDSVPDEIEAEDIGFHPKYGADFWDNEDGRLVFQRDFEPGEEYTTVYGLRARDTESVERFLGEPELERVHPPRADEGEDDDVGQVVSDVMNEGGATDATRAAEASDDDLQAAIAAADVNDDADLDAAIRSVEAGGDTADTTAAADSETGSRPANAGGSLSVEDVASALATEIRSGSVDDGDLETLRDALGVDRPEGSVKARISHLQTEVSDLQAYTSALEEFLDENGEAQSLLRDLQTSIEVVGGELDDVRVEVDQVSATAADATAEVDGMSETVSELQSSVQSVTDRLDNLKTDVTEVRSDVESVRSEVGSIRDDVGRVERGVDEVHEEVERDIEEVREEVERDIEEVREEMPDAELEGLDDRVEDIDDRIVDLEEELEQLAQMRERMASVFGGAPAGDDTDEEE